MTLTSILAEIYRRANYDTVPASAVTTRLTAFVNTTHRQILSIPGLDPLREGVPPITFASVNAQSTYGLPQAVAVVQGITDRTTVLKLALRSLDWLRMADPGLVQTGPPEAYIPLGYQQVQIQPTAATGLWVVSSSAGDTTQTARIETIRTGGYLSTASASLNGITRVALGALTDHIEVAKFYLSAVGVGTISLYDAAAAGNELARIAIGQTSARYLSIQLWPTPSSAITYYVDYTRAIPDMSVATDEPLLPDDFHWLLVEGALVKEWTKQDDDRRRSAQADFAAGLKDLAYRVTCPPDFLPSRTGDRLERSRLGAYFADGAGIR